MAVVGARVTVGVTAVAVADSASDTTDVSGIVSGQKNGYAANIRNRGTVAVYLGDSGVTTGTGFQLDVGESINLWVYPGDVVYGISGTAGQRVDVLKGAA
jgi:hypothetical protein